VRNVDLVLTALRELLRQGQPQHVGQ
jgi:hypothetical protein